VCGCRRPSFFICKPRGRILWWVVEGWTDRQSRGGEEYKGRCLFYSHASFTPDRRAFENSTSSFMMKNANLSMELMLLGNANMPRGKRGARP